MKSDFTRKLLHWHKTKNKREMPWKGEKDPYKIWLSEIILQQTRVEQGWAYYERFIRNYPDIRQLAAAPDTEVMKLWEGLGYYSRCRNLLITARLIVSEHNAIFPADYNSILRLKGIGPYTAAAIASFAFQLPHAVVDGNVQRIIARYFGITTPIDSSQGKLLFNKLAGSLLSPKEPAAYNQAIMDFGATLCKPKQPRCPECPFQKDCVALSLNQVQQLPVKEKTLQKKQRWFYYYIFEYKKQYGLHRRIARDIWQDLYEFVLQEQDAATGNETMHRYFLDQICSPKTYQIKSISKVYRQQLSHQTIFGCFIRVTLRKPLPALKQLEWVNNSAISRLPFPGLINQYLEAEPLEPNPPAGKP